MTKYTITRERLARSPLATGPGYAWRWLYNVSRGGTEIARGVDLFATARRMACRDAAKNNVGPFHIEKGWDTTKPAPADQATCDRIRAAIEPMTAAIAVDHLKWICQQADQLRAEIAAAREEIRDAVNATPETTRPWGKPAWLGDGARSYARTAAAAIVELAKFIDPWHLAARSTPDERLRMYARAGLTESYRSLQFVDAGAAPVEARKRAEDNVAAAVAKLAAKVECLGPTTGSDIAGRTTNAFTLALYFANGWKVGMRTERIVNRRGHTLFNQWPTRLYLMIPGRGPEVKISESALKDAAANLAAR